MKRISRIDSRIASFRSQPPTLHSGNRVNGQGQAGIIVSVRSRDRDE